MPASQAERDRRTKTAAFIRALLALALGACSDDPGSDVDAGTGDGGGATDAGGLVAPPVAPAPAAIPVLPCPDGWRSVAPRIEGGPATCDPWPEGGPLECAAGEAWFPGDSACAPVGSACPTGEWPTDLPAASGTTRYVRAGAASGDGSMVSPFGTIADAMSASGAGDVIALAKGSYDEVVVLRAGVALVGACARDTILTAPAASGITGTVHVRGAGSVLRNVTIGGSRIGIVASGAGVVGTLEGVVIDGAWAAALFAETNARIVGSGVVVRSTVATTTGNGQGLVARAGGQIELDRALLERNTYSGTWSSGPGTRIALTAAAVRETQPAAGGRAGPALYVLGGSTVELRRSVLESNREASVLAGNEGTMVIVEDSLIRESLPYAADAQAGRGIALEVGARATVARTTIEGSREASVTAAGAGVEIDLTDVVLRDNLGVEATGFAGDGAIVQEGARMGAERLWIEAVRGTGLFVLDGATATVADVTIAETQSHRSDGMFGRGISVQGAQLIGQRVAIVRARDVGVFSDGTAAVVRLEDLVVRDTQVRDADGTWGRGVHVQFGGHVALTRAVLDANHDAAAGAAHEGTILELVDVALTRTEAETTGEFGRGLNVGLGARVTGARVRVAGNRDGSVLAFHAGTDISLTDVVVTETLPRACVADGCAPAGNGVGAYIDAHVRLDRFEISHNALCGVQLARGGTVDLADGDVASNPCGANVQTPEFDLDRLMDRVRWRDNEVMLDAAALPVPDANVEP